MKNCLQEHSQRRWCSDWQAVYGQKMLLKSPSSTSTLSRKRRFPVSLDYAGRHRDVSGLRERLDCHR